MSRLSVHVRRLDSPEQTRAWTRAVLRRYSGDGLLAGRWGKPHFARERLDFNLSHSGCWAAVAIGDLPVGVDIETLRARPAVEGHLDHLRPDSPEKLVRWTQLEARNKQLGIGFSQGLEAVTAGRVGVWESIAGSVERFEQQPFQFWGLWVASDVHLSVCTQSALEPTAMTWAVER